MWLSCSLVPFQDEVQSLSESPPNFRPPPPPGSTTVRHGSPKGPIKRPLSKLSHTNLFFSTPCRMHQENHPQNHVHPRAHSPCSAHTSPCTIHHTSSPCSIHASPPPCSLHHSSPCSAHRNAGPPVGTQAKDLVQFLMSRQAAVLSPHPESPSQSRAGTPTPSLSPRSSPSLSPSLLMPAAPPCSPEKPETSSLAPSSSPSMAQAHRLNPEAKAAEERPQAQPRGKYPWSDQCGLQGDHFLAFYFLSDDHNIHSVLYARKSLGSHVRKYCWL